MRKIDHVRKTIYIIVGILTIISLVFSLYKKISHAASDSSSGWVESADSYLITNFPLPFGVSSNVGFRLQGLTEERILNAITTTMSQNDYNRWVAVNNPTHCLVCVTEDSGSYLDVMITFKSDSFYSSGNFPSYTISSGARYSYRFDSSGSDRLTSTVNLGGVTSTPSLSSSFFDQNILYKNVPALYYPLALYDISSGSLVNEIKDSSGNVIFSAVSSGSGGGDMGGHSKGGVLSNYIDSEDLLENSSDLPKVDTSAPSDPSSNSGWFQKILNGIGRLNQSIQAGVLTIGDYIGSIGDSIGEKIDNIYSWLTEDFDKDEFQNGLNSIPLISDLNGLKTLVENSGMFNWSDVKAAQTVSFTFDFGGAVLPHTSTIIDFSWYTGTIKNICVALICTFLVLGLLVTIINQLPSIIGGHSGDKGGGSDS